MVLAPRDQADETLSWTAPSTAVGDPDQCTAFIGFAEVILPDDTQPFIVDGDLGQICGNRTVDSGAFAAGQGS